MKHIEFIRRTPLSTFLILALHSAYAEAGGVYTWSGVNDNNATDIRNWAYSDAPSSDYNQFVINSDSRSPVWVHDDTVPPSPPFSSLWSTRLAVGQQAGTTGSLDIKRADSSGGGIGMHSAEVGENGGQGTLNIHAPEMPLYPGSSTVLQLSNGLTIGSGLNSRGTVNILGSGKNTQMQNMQSATLDLGSGTMTIGSLGGHGVMNVNGGSINAGSYNSQSTPNFTLGQGLGSYGEVNVLAGGKFAHGMNNPTGTADTQPRIGDAGGTGKLNITGSLNNDTVSRAHFGSGLSVGYGAGSIGEVRITEGGEMLTGNTFNPDSYNPQTGSYDVINPVSVGVAGGTGRVLIDGTSSGGKASVWRVIGPFYATGGLPMTDGKLYIGASGQGDVTVANGGVLDIGKGNYGAVYDYSDPNYPKSYYHLTDFTSGTGIVYLGVGAGSSGSLNIGAGQGRAPQAPGIVNAAEIQFGAGSGSLVFNHTSADGVLSFKPQLVSGSGQSNIIHLAGVTRLEDVDGRDQRSFTGLTRVAGGTLVVDTRLGGAMTVESGGTLAGLGSAGSTTIKSGGTLAPARFTKSSSENSRLYVDSLTFEPGSILEIGISDNNLSDDVWATTINGGSGKITITGGTIQVKARPGAWNLRDYVYTVLRSDSSDVTGQFTAVTTDLAFLKLKAEYYPDSVVLRTFRNSTEFEDIPDDDNGKGTGGAVEDLGPDNPIYEDVIGMTPDQAKRAFENLGGEIHGGVQSALLNTSRYARLAVNRHLLELPLDTQKGLWIDTWGYDGSLDGNDKTARLDYNGTGFLMGLDTYRSESGETTFGFAMGYERSKMSIGSTRQSNTDVNVVHGLAYGRTQLGSVDLRSGFGVSSMEVDTTRNVNVSSVAGKYTADYSALNLQAFIEASRRFSLSEKVGLTPYINLSHQQLETRSFTEHGGNAALHGRANTSRLTSSIIGFYTHLTVDPVLSIYSDLGWRHNFNNDATGVDLNFVDGSRRFRINGPKLNNDSVVASLGVGFKLRKDMTFRLGYEGEFGQLERENAAKAQFEWYF